MSQKEEVGEECIQLDEHLIDSYERHLDNLIREIEKTGDKAVKIARLDGLLFGLLFTGLSLLLTVETVPVYLSYPSISIMLGGGITAIFISLIFSIVSYSEQTYYHGPRPSYIREVKGTSQKKNRVQNMMYSGYEEAIEGNKETLTQRTKQVHYALSFLLFGLLSVSWGVLLMITNFSPLLRGGLVASAAIFIAGLAIYFHKEAQLPVLGFQKEHLDRE